ncbi:MHO_1590 family protein [Mycoplasmopsis glycophila]|nr:hypothetical protein [Mycoplasmopsis glycophila]
MLAVFLFATSTGILLYKVIQTRVRKNKENQDPKNKSSQPDEKHKRLSLFPKLDQEFFKTYIKQDEEGTYYIDETIILAIMKDITSRFGTSEGKIEFHYEKIKGTSKENDHFILYLQYKNQKYTERKKYKIFLTN